MSYGLPYKGSKSRIAEKLVTHLPSREHFYDLFCGGGAMTHMAALTGRWGDYAINDINPQIPKFFMDCVTGEMNECRWVTREEFKEYKGSDAYTALIFSFGNNLKTYLYDEDIEPLKRLFHLAITTGDYKELKSMGLDLSSIDSLPTMRAKRIAAQNMTIGKEGFERLFTCETLARVERAQNLKRLQRPLNGTTTLSGNIGNAGKLAAFCMDYTEVPIKDNSLIYCDIPYIGTDGYTTTFDHERFYEWACSQKEDVFISSYEMPEDRFECIAEYALNVTFYKYANGRNAVERLFIPRGQKHIKTTLF